MSADSSSDDGASLKVSGSSPSLSRRRPLDQPQQDFSAYRLDQPLYRRLVLAFTGAGFIGLFLGVSKGAQTSALRFRAENSHRLPTSERGWYLYHKSKNYNVAVGSAKEGTRMAGKLIAWTGLFFAIEDVVDRARVRRAYIEGDHDDAGARMRRKKDLISTVTAGMTTSAIFSAWNRLPFNTTLHTVKVGFYGSLSFGILQDTLTLARGHRLAYVDWVRRISGLTDASSNAQEIT